MKQLVSVENEKGNKDEGMNKQVVSKSHEEARKIAGRGSHVVYKTLKTLLLLFVTK